MKKRDAGCCPVIPSLLKRRARQRKPAPARSGFLEANHLLALLAQAIDAEVHFIAR